MATLLDEPTPFWEALKHLAKKAIMPTTLGSGELQGIDAAIRRQSFFSAKTTIEELLGEYKNVVESIINPTTGMSKDRETAQNPSGFVTSGFNPTTARTQIKDLLERMNYQAPEGKKGTIQDLSSDARIDLVVDTNTKLAHGAGSFVQQNSDPDVVDQWPALEFVRFEDRDEPRDWELRWKIAAQTAGDPAAFACLEKHGKMVALKSSGIWQALGDGAGGYMDTLGNPYPPFAFRSGMNTMEVDRDEAIELGLIQEGEPAQPSPLDFSSLFSEAA